MPRRKFPKICFDRVVSMPLPPPLPATEGDRRIPTPQWMAINTATLWQPAQTIRVRFLDGEASVKSKVEQVAHTWEQFANLKLVFGDDPSAEVRISFVHDPGSWSYMGTDALLIPKDQATMNYGWLKANTANEEYNRVVLHEFGHALGCVHEHQSPAAGIPWNKPAVYRFYGGPPNFWSPAQVDANIFQKYDGKLTQYSVFDTQSIMLYPIAKELTDGVFSVGLNNALSQTDKEFIAKMYPFDAKKPLELAVGAAPTSASIGAHGEEDSYRFTVATPGAYVIETSGPTDVLLDLYGPTDPALHLAHDDDSGQGFNARISRTLQPGLYFVKVRHYRPRGTGNYAITINKG